MLVHRGIYEAAKGIYEQFIPEIMEHLNKHGERAKLQFTGHSLGGSLSLLVHLMLLTRKIVMSSALRPVVTFGSPFVFCGGQKILNYLGLDDNHVHCVMMHRDIVPRAFSCNYPNHVTLILKRLNGSFQSHPCLNKNVSTGLINLIFPFTNHLFCYSLRLELSKELDYQLHGIRIMDYQNFSFTFSCVLCRNSCTLHLGNYSYSNLMRSHLLHTLYSLQEVHCILLIKPNMGSLQVP